MPRSDPPPVDIRAAAAGSRLRCRVRPGSRRSRIEGPCGGALKIAIHAAPEKGRANEETEALLASALDLPRRAVRIVAGAGSRDKTVEIAGLTPPEVLSRLRL